MFREPSVQIISIRVSRVPYNFDLKNRSEIRQIIRMDTDFLFEDISAEQKRQQLSHTI